ncbi:MarR family winged helix-turn-helix transcriptional regulator [Neptuniibacter halophilus]|uniref:MarR family winged helix-turn-helix transcriptional regulator n=1 Tax=Neptuniibacter halophilus TaxID=651666 RepID=UPI0025739C94|nr:MarR family transcriptional regulator [Neptuniibacter halophilus]
MTSRDKKLEKYLPSSASFQIDEFPFYWVAKLNALYSREMEKTLKPLNMDISRWRVAMLLRVHGDLSIKDITEHALAKLPTITKIVYKMRDEGLVDVQPSELDGRVSIVSLTEQGRDKVEQVRQQTHHLFTEAFSGMTETQINRSTALLKKYFENLSEVE